MSDETVQVEGDTLEEALMKAAGELGVEREGVDFKYDREHLAAGASTVRIFATKKSPEAIAEARARAQAEAHSSRGSEHSHGDHGGERREFGGERRDHGRGGDRRGPPRSGDRHAGPRSSDRRGPPRSGGDRDRGRDAGGDRRGPPRRDPEIDRERDERLRERARVIAQRVLAGEGPLAMPDLNSYERHLVHTIVAETGGLVSKSVGESLRKTVEISKGSAVAAAAPVEGTPSAQ